MRVGEEAVRVAGKLLEEPPLCGGEAYVRSVAGASSRRPGRSPWPRHCSARMRQDERLVNHHVHCPDGFDGGVRPARQVP